MVKFLSSWVKTFGLTVVIISILEMLLPNNKTKKYIRVVMGIYVVFTMISPFISNKEIFSTFSSIENIENIDLDEYATNQTSMDRRLEELYEDELEKDIIKKLDEKGYEVKNCKVKVSISGKEEETQITKIKVNAQKSEKTQKSEKNVDDNVENKIVAEIQKIKPVDTRIKSEKEKSESQKGLDKTDIQNIKKFLIDEYEVNEKCLEIN